MPLNVLVACFLAPLCPQTVVGPITPAPRRVLDPHLEFRDYPLSFALFPAYGPTVGSRLLTTPSEALMQVDLNQDGDLLDSVLHSIDLSTENLRSLDLSGGQFFADAEGGTRALWSVNELGNGGDLNGDGDASDWVLFAIDPRQGTPRNSGLASDRAQVSGDLAAIAVNELAQGSDLNGDGRRTTVLFRWNLAGTGAPLSTGLEIDDLVAAHAGYFLFRVFESPAGIDRNGDGDTNDRVLFALDGRTGAVVATGLALELMPLARIQHSLFFASETRQSRDLNGDGDLVDHVAHVFDLASGELMNLGLALGVPSVVVAGGGTSTATWAELAEDSAAFHVSEPDQGGLDLNGDGDALDRDVLFVHRFDVAETRNLGLSAWNFALGDGRLALQVNEASQGGVDLDGDGTSTGFVAHVHELATGSTWNSGVATPAASFRSEILIHARHVALSAGSGLAPTLVWLDSARRRVHATGLRLDPWSNTLQFQPSGTLSVLVSESGMNLDLDADGDLADQVLHLLQPALGGLWNTGAPVQLLFGGFQQVVPFLALESDDGLDHNGDGDALDAVLRTVKLGR